MKLPTQFAPVQRIIPTASGSMISSGAEASGIFDDILKDIGVIIQSDPHGKCDSCLASYMSFDPEGKRLPTTYEKAYQLCEREERCAPKKLW